MFAQLLTKASQLERNMQPVDIPATAQELHPLGASMILNNNGTPDTKRFIRHHPWLGCRLHGASTDQAEIALQPIVSAQPIVTAGNHKLLLAE